MTFTTRARALALTIGFSLASVLVACGPKDADIKTAAEAAIAGTPGISVDVANGVATISGQYASDAAKASTDSLVKAVKGVKSVVDNATVAPPPPPPVVMSPDDSLKANATAALKDYPTLTVDVKDGVITLTGEIQKAALPKAMQALSALKPKKIENKATVKK